MKGGNILLNRYWTDTKVATLLFVVCLALFYRSFRYGFATDDFDGLVIHSWAQLWTEWTNVSFRRPLDELFFFSFQSLFGYDPLPFRVFLFIVYFANSFLVYRLTLSLIGNQIIGGVVAIFFAANTVQFRSIYWISCNLLLFATTFYLAALMLFVRYLKDKSSSMLVTAYGLALVGLLLTKEDLITFPLATLLVGALMVLHGKGTLYKEDFIPILRPTLVFWTLPLIFIGFRTMMYWTLGGDEDCPYNLLACFRSEESSFAVSFLGIHVVQNLLSQVYWNLGSFGLYWPDRFYNDNAGDLEWMDLGQSEYFLIFLFSAALVGLYWILRKSVSGWYLVIGISWFVGTLSLTLVMPKHVFPYFSSYPALGLFWAIMVPLRDIAKRCPRAVRIGGTLLVVVFFANSLYWMQANERVNIITTHAVLMQQLEKDLKHLYPVLPVHSNVVFLNLSQWRVKYGRALQAMYHDRTLNVLTSEDFIEQAEDGKILSTRPVELNRKNTHVFLGTSQGFKEVTPVFFKFYGGSVP